MKELVFHRMFFPAIERFASKVGFHDGDYHATFATHADRVLRLADAMRTRARPQRRRPVRGDGRATATSTSSCTTPGFLGAGIINPLNLRLAGKELQFILADSGTKVVFVDAVFAEHFDRNIAEVRADLPLRHVVLIGDGDAPHDVRYEDLIDGGDPGRPRRARRGRPRVLMYTGGTTGLPKGVLLDQRAEMLEPVPHRHRGRASDDDRVYLHQTPMFHAASMGGDRSASRRPAARRCSSRCSTRAQCWTPSSEYPVDWTVMVPTMIAHAARPSRRSGPSGSRRCTDLVYGASPMPAALLDRLLRRRFPALDLCQGYGMTECSSVLTVLDAEDHRPGGACLRSAGRPVDRASSSRSRTRTATVAARRARTARSARRAATSCASTGTGPRQTADAFRGGWYHTGDAGHLDDGGLPASSSTG